MKKMRIFSGVCVLAGIMVIVLATGILSFAANTQDVTFSQAVTSSISVTGATINFGTVTPGVPSTQNDASTVELVSNANWTVTLAGTNFTKDTLTIPIGRLQARKGTDSFAAVTTGGIAIGSGNPGSNSLVMDYQLATLATDAAADGYTSTLTFTVSNS